MIGLDGRGKRCPDLGCDFGGRPAEFPEPVHAYDVARLRRSGGSTVWLAQASEVDRAASSHSADIYDILRRQAAKSRQRLAT